MLSRAAVLSPARAILQEPFAMEELQALGHIVGVTRDTGTAKEVSPGQRDSLREFADGLRRSGSGDTRGSCQRVAR